MKELTEREKLILGYVTAGKTNIEISKELFISVHTVKAHISSIMRKFGVQKRINIAVLSILHNLVDKKDIEKYMKKNNFSMIF